MRRWKKKVKNKIIAFLLCMTCISGTIIISNKSEAREREEEIEVTTVAEEIQINKQKQISDELDIDYVRDEIRSQFAFKQTKANNTDVSNGCELLQFPQLSDEDIYYLKKIATCEAGDAGVETMSLVMLAVLNRVKSPRFPNTIYEVIVQKVNGIYQFSVCKPGGSWYRKEPNEDSEKAFNMIWDSLYDYSNGVLYFESCKDKDNWHSRTLEYLYESGGIRFYR
jgi:spore germination cell wall hydrolase CwlJ-like protein